MGTPFAPQQNTAWAQPQGSARNQTNRQHFGAAPDRHFRSNSASDRSSSANEVENMLMNSRPPARRTSDQGGWTTTGQRVRPTQQRGVLLFVNSDLSKIYLSVVSLCSCGETNAEWIQTSQIVICGVTFQAFIIASKHCIKLYHPTTTKHILSVQIGQ